MMSAAADSTNKRKASDDEGQKGAKKQATEQISPHDAYFAKRRAIMDERGYTGSVLIKGIPRDADDDDDDNEDDDENEDTSKYTTAQMESLRFVMINQSRSDHLDEMRRLILGDQADSCFMMFNTSFSYKVADSLRTIKSMMQRTKYKSDPAEKFNLLFAYTFTVKQYDVWMHDNEGDMDQFTKGLAGMWKRLLKSCCDEDLTLDVEYTKPALEEFLRQFKKEVESVDLGSCSMKFNYK